ncbi:MAG: ribonuclease P protein component [Prevotella sp.]|nr:ribonuclease P protein component [Prevotella sp.]MBQ6210605.1 ribonuclease P protein component [Prevotella sp.]
MAAPRVFTFRKEERICSKKQIDQLFGGSSSHSVVVFPIRAVFMETPREEGEPPVKMMVSVSKRHFKRAVKRNRIKRQLREAFRRNKTILMEKMNPRPDKGLVVAFLWIGNKLLESAQVERKMCDVLNRIKERI